VERSDGWVRAIFVALAAAIPAWIVAHDLRAWDPLARMPAAVLDGFAVVGGLSLAFGLLVCVANLHLRVAAPWLHRRNGGDPSAYDGPSVLPIVGSLLVAIAAIGLPPSPPLGIALLTLYFLDGGGLAWIAVALLRGEA
jgi:hypothetical protein